MIEKSLNIKTISVILLVLLFTSVDTILFGTNSNKLFLYVPRIVGVLAVFLLPILSSGSVKRIRLTIKETAICFVLLLIMCLSAYINNESIETLLSRIITLLVAYVICQTISSKDYILVFDKFMSIVSFFAICTELIAYVLPVLIRSLPAVVNTAGYTYRVFFFGGLCETNIGSALIRSSGIFWEPGAFAIYLIVAIIYQLYFFKNPDLRKLLLYVVCLFTTFSTTGYLAFFVLLLTYLISSRSSNVSKNLKAILIVLSVVVLLITLFIDNSVVFSTVFSKLTSGESRATTRYSSFFYGMRVAFDHPVFGVSSDTRKYMAEYVYSSSSVFRNGGTSITNTFVGQFASYGLVFGTIFVIGTFKYLKNLANKFHEWALLCLIISMAYMGEKFFSFFPLVMVFYGFAVRKGENDENRSY